MNSLQSHRFPGASSPTWLAPIRLAPRGLSLIAFILLSGAGPGFLRARVADGPQVAYEKAARLAKSGDTRASVKILAQLLKNQPAWVQPRALLARILFKSGKTDAAEKQAEAILRLDRNNKIARAILGKRKTSGSRTSPSLAGAAAAEGNKTVLLVGGPVSYSPWDRIWTLSGKESFGLGEYQGGEGYTLFSFPATKDNPDDWNRYEIDAHDKELYFLRVVDLILDGETVDLSLAGVKDHQVPAVPYMILVDPNGDTIARGTPDDVESALEKVRKESEKRKQSTLAANTALVSSADFSSSTANIESLSANGWKTVVMVTSPG